MMGVYLVDITARTLQSTWQPLVVLECHHLPKDGTQLYQEHGPANYLSISKTSVHKTC